MENGNVLTDTNGSSDHVVLTPQKNGLSHAPNNTSSKIAVKADFNGILRRFTITVLSYDEVVEHVCELFGLNEQSIAIKYKDEEGDLITFSSDDELAEAFDISAGSCLRLFVVNEKQQQQQQQQSPLSQPRNITVSTSRVVPYYPPAPVDFAKLKAEAKLQKKLLKHEKKLAKGEKKIAKDAKKLFKDDLKRKHEGKDEKKFAEKKAKEEKREKREETLKVVEQLRSSYGSRQQSNPFLTSSSPAVRAPTTWMEQRMALRQQQPERWRHHNEKAAHKHHKQSKELEKVQQRQKKIAARNLRARFVKHVSVPDGTEFQPNVGFTKTWRFRNEGHLPWPENCQLLFISKMNGDKLSAPDVVTLPYAVPVGEEIDVAVEMVSPSQPGRYVGFWRLCTPFGRKFGQRVWVKIDVVCSSSDDDDDDDDDDDEIDLHRDDPRGSSLKKEVEHFEATNGDYDHLPSIRSKDKERVKDEDEGKEKEVEHVDNKIHDVGRAAQQLQNLDLQDADGSDGDLTMKQNGDLHTETV